MNSLRDFNDLHKLLKENAQMSVGSSYPVAIMYGKVISSSPLEINVEQRMVLDRSFLILSKSVTDYTGSVYIDGKYHSFTIDNSLKTNDKVILLRQQGGQKYIVLDKVVN